MNFRSAFIFGAMLFSTTAILAAEKKDPVETIRDQYAVLMEKGQYSEALSMSDRVLPMCTEDDKVPVWYERGLMLENLHRDSEAMQWYDKAIAMAPLSPILVGKGNILAKMHRFTEAIEIYNRAIQTDPANVRAYASRAASEIAIKQEDNALKDLDRAIQLDPKSAESYCNRGTLELHKHEYEKAKADLEKAIQLKPSNGIAYAERALVYWNLRDKPKALLDAEKAAKLDPLFRATFEQMKTTDVTQALNTQTAVKDDGVDKLDAK